MAGRPAVKASGLAGPRRRRFSRPGSNGPSCPSRPTAAAFYLVVNADESEPGTCKDREIMRNDPHKLVEGCLIAGAAMGCTAGYIFIRGGVSCKRPWCSMPPSRKPTMQACSARTPAARAIDYDLYLHRGAGAYICGEETGLIEALEGKKGQPRLKPPFPAGVGLYGRPTTVNNVESDRRHAGRSCSRGAEWFAGIGPDKNQGTKLFCVSGHVNKPCNVEEAMGIPLARTDRQALRRRARRLGQLCLAVIPGGSLGADDAEARLRRHQYGLRQLAWRRLRPRHGGRHRHGQVHRPNQGHRPALEILHARELRPVHALPRRHRLALADDGAHGHGQCQGWKKSIFCSRSPRKSKATRFARSATPPLGQFRA